MPESVRVCTVYRVSDPIVGTLVLIAIIFRLFQTRSRKKKRKSQNKLILFTFLAAIPSEKRRLGELYKSSHPEQPWEFVVRGWLFPYPLSFFGTGLLQSGPDDVASELFRAVAGLSGLSWKVLLRCVDLHKLTMSATLVQCFIFEQVGELVTLETK